MEKPFKPTICVDFDGVLNTYTKYDGDNCYEPRPRAKEFLLNLCKEGFEVKILSTRRPVLIENWLQENGMSGIVSEVTNKKVPGVLYIDDRGYKFNGNYEDAVAAAKTWKHYPWYKDAKENS